MFNKGSVASEIMKRRKPDGSITEESPKENYGLMACAEDFLRAVEAKNPSQIAKAFQDMFDVCESQPHQEYNHDEDTE